MSIAVIEYPKTDAQLADELSAPDWHRYMGRKAQTLPGCGARNLKHGSISFAEHLGKPLSPKLWEDIVFRIGAQRLLVTRGEVTSENSIFRTLHVFIGPTGLVTDIVYHP